MTEKIKKAALYAMTAVILLATVFYVSMDDYQKANMSHFISQLLSDSANEH